MIAFIARFIGLWMIAGALVALVIDGTKTIAASTLTVTPLGQSWYSISPSTLMSAQSFVQGTDRILYRALAVGSAHLVDPAPADLAGARPARDMAGLCRTQAPHDCGLRVLNPSKGEGETT